MKIDLFVRDKLEISSWQKTRQCAALAKSGQIHMSHARASVKIHAFFKAFI